MLVIQNVGIGYVLIAIATILLRGGRLIMFDDSCHKVLLSGRTDSCAEALIALLISDGSSFANPLVISCRLLISGSFTFLRAISSSVFNSLRNSSWSCF